MGCQREIAEKIINKEADYIFGLKGNQPNLEEEVKSYFDLTKEDLFKIKSINNALSYHKTVDGDHGRIETREYFISTNLDLIFSKDKWARLKSICKIISTREINGKERQALKEKCL